MSNIDIIKRFSEAFFDKKIEIINEVVGEDYWFKGPMMQMSSREELIGFIQNMPLYAKETSATYIQQGDMVVKNYTCDFSTPPIGEQELCEIFTVKDGKIIGNKLFYDTAPWPKPDEQGEQAN